MQPGQSSVIAKTTGAPLIQKEDAAAFTDWINHRLIFTDKPASYVFNEVEQEFGIDISAPQPILETRISSGGLALENVDSTLNNLGLVLDGTFEARGKNTFRFIPKH